MSCLGLAIICLGVPLGIMLGNLLFHRLVGYPKRLRLQSQVQIGDLASYRRAFHEIYGLTEESLGSVIRLDPYLRLLPEGLICFLGLSLFYGLMPEPFKLYVGLIAFFVVAALTFHHESIEDRQRMAARFRDVLESHYHNE